MTAFGNGTSITGKALNTAFKDIQGQIDSLTATPVGSLIMYGGLGNAIPASFLLCDGSSLSTTTYASLFAVVGYTYGGSFPSFNLPNLVGSYVALGTSSTSAVSGVRAGVSLTSGNTSVDHSHANSVLSVSDQSPVNHNHTITPTNNSTDANHDHGMTNNNTSANHSHTHGSITTGGHNFLFPSTGNHTHGYFKPNGAGANTTVNSAIHADHYHFTNGGSTAADNATHSHANATVANNTTHSHANSANAGDQSVNHSHTVTLTNNTQSVTHTHASATGALVCFIIKYQ